MSWKIFWYERSNKKFYDSINIKDWKNIKLYRNYLIGNMYLTVDSLIEITNKITDSNNATLRKSNVKPYRFDKMYIDKKWSSG